MNSHQKIKQVTLIGFQVSVGQSGQKSFEFRKGQTKG